MAITPADIEKKTFSTALRGYDLDEVDDFLDEMVVAVRELEEELARAKERVAQLEKTRMQWRQPPSCCAGPTRSRRVRSRSRPHRRPGGSGQDARRSTKRGGQDRRGRQVGGRHLRPGAELKKAEVDAEMAEMTGLVAGVRNKLAVLATTVADKLDEMDAVVAGAHSRGSTRHGNGRYRYTRNPTMPRTIWRRLRCRESVSSTTKLGHHEPGTRKSKVGMIQSSEGRSRPGGGPGGTRVRRPGERTPALQRSKVGTARRTRRSGPGPVPQLAGQRRIDQERDGPSIDVEGLSPVVDALLDGDREHLGADLGGMRGDGGCESAGPGCSHIRTTRSVTSRPASRRSL